jgi:hypothetical protein
MYVGDDTPTDESRSGARFYLDPNSISMCSGDQFYILSGRSSAFNLYFRYYNDQYQIRATAIDDSFAYQFTTWNSLSGEPHLIEIDWAAASAPAANDGDISLYIDGDLKSTRSGIDNDARRVDEVWAGIDSGTPVPSTSMLSNQVAWITSSTDRPGLLNWWKHKTRKLGWSITQINRPCSRLAGSPHYPRCS